MPSLPLQMEHEESCLCVKIACNNYNNSTHVSIFSAGCLVGTSVYGIHRNATVWENPNVSVLLICFHVNLLIIHSFHAVLCHLSVTKYHVF